MTISIQAIRESPATPYATQYFGIVLVFNILIGMMFSIVLLVLALLFPPFALLGFVGWVAMAFINVLILFYLVGELCDDLINGEHQ